MNSEGYVLSAWLFCEGKSCCKEAFYVCSSCFIGCSALSVGSYAQEVCFTIQKKFLLFFLYVCVYNFRLHCLITSNALLLRSVYISMEDAIRILKPAIFWNVLLHDSYDCFSENCFLSLQGIRFFSRFVLKPDVVGSSFFRNVLYFYQTTRCHIANNYSLKCYHSTQYMFTSDT